MAKNGAARRVVVKVDELTFGVEIECALPRGYVREHNIQVGAYHRGAALPAPFASGWTAQHDGSLSFSGDLVALEIVSPVLHGLAGLEEVARVFNLLNAAGAQVNQSCGFHVHVGVNSVLGERANDPALLVRWVRRLLHLVSVHELALFALGGDPARQRSRYCQSIKTEWAGVLTTHSPLKKLTDKVHDIGRYQVLNLCNLENQAKRTVEFRVFGATLLGAQAVGYVLTALGLAHRAAQDGTAPQFDAQPRPVSEVVAAVEELRQALRQYGWPTGAAQQFRVEVAGAQAAAAQRFN